ncbi:MAG: pyridoxamine kinase [Desulfovibrio sp.]|nr:pyridoxamine kinase [Desulfovibrio sp.]
MSSQTPPTSYPVKRVCAIHDLSGFGRASLTLVIPILSALGIQVCPLPTAVLSSQTSGMQGFSFCDLTDEMPRFLEHWATLNLAFDCVYSGFLGNPVQIEMAETCMQKFLLPTGFAFVDPVLGDNGQLDPTQTPEMVAAQRQLVSHAQIIAPNLTEAAFLLNEPYREDLPLQALKEELVALSALGPEMVVITSAPSENPANCAVVAYERASGRFWKVENKRYPVFYPGTGDTFSSVVCGALLLGETLPKAIARASAFVELGISLTYGEKIDPRDGVLLERALPMLNRADYKLEFEEV